MATFSAILTLVFGLALIATGGWLTFTQRPLASILFIVFGAFVMLVQPNDGHIGHRQRVTPSGGWFSWTGIDGAKRGLESTSPGCPVGRRSAEWRSQSPCPRL
ncbi:MAG TPA: hypothetical protein VGR16_13100 [Thermomicrobiales bacterium]|nr:hypothetical protein [Thermomicrobiales bacterium]